MLLPLQNNLAEGIGEVTGTGAGVITASGDGTGLAAVIGSGECSISIGGYAAGEHPVTNIEPDGGQWFRRTSGLRYLGVQRRRIVEGEGDGSFSVIGAGSGTVGEQGDGLAELRLFAVADGEHLLDGEAVGIVWLTGVAFGRHLELAHGNGRAGFVVMGQADGESGAAGEGFVALRMSGLAHGEALQLEMDDAA